jgi:hypothetical protein
MTYQQAAFVKNLVKEKHPLNEVAQLFFNRFGSTDVLPVKNKKYSFSNLDGSDLKNVAQSTLNEKF